MMICPCALHTDKTVTHFSKRVPWRRYQSSTSSASRLQCGCNVSSIIVCIKPWGRSIPSRGNEYAC
ncbi:hypothetical protein PAXRUDRAFT_692387 [Paxillus rubicundulus Ve08.2h10]|uniref:Uncharacterized protein n=1 Tax=Paxillus rubicundulus Ve08.2h10 TaxID=930991 RepID=A0A0D0DUZ9_9AGAM|nr:hypothetical protein PAXRUDRAFT_692387 [Paxillus rubicundulus Ve08.2h10]